MHQKCANVETFDEHIKKVHEEIVAEEWLEVFVGQIAQGLVLSLMSNLI